uniref:Uncharacterized protein n=1 Tax=Arundo donax TaxID=35708 RepID=A0A0A9FQA8_ARUDO
MKAAHEKARETIYRQRSPLVSLALSKITKVERLDSFFPTVYVSYKADSCLILLCLWTFNCSDVLTYQLLI